MGNIVTNVYAKSNYYDRLRIDKALGFRKSDNNNKRIKNMNKVCSDLVFVSG